MAAAGVLPVSQRAVWPTKPCASVPETPAIGAPLVDGVVVVVVVDGVVVASSDVGGVVVSVTVDGGGTATVASGLPPLEWSPNASTAASTTAAVNSTTIAATRPTCVLVKRDARTGAGGWGCDGALGEW